MQVSKVTFGANLGKLPSVNCETDKLAIVTIFNCVKKCNLEYNEKMIAKQLIRVSAEGVN